MIYEFFIFMCVVNLFCGNYEFFSLLFVYIQGKSIKVSKEWLMIRKVVN